MWWRFCELKGELYICQQEGVVYADELDQRSVSIIRNFAHTERAEVEDGCPADIRFESRTEFVNGEFWDALRAGAVVVCFNSPFDLSRLALEYREAQIKNSGWSMVMWKYQGEADKLRPKLRIKPKDSRSAFISLAGGDPNNRVVYRGRFLDLSVLCWALRNRHLTLDDALVSFGVGRKMKHEPTGTVTIKELRYGRRDVKQTVALLNAMKREYDGFALRLPPEQAFSAASITKAFLDKMGIKQPIEKFDLSEDISGKCMQAYYGGRSEVRIRHQEVPVVVCDTTSEYPTVAGLLGLWPLLTAASVRVESCAREAQKYLRNADIDTMLDPKQWRNLAFFASIKPEGDVLPVRAIYNDTGDTNIGVNPLTSKEPIWYSGPDLAASKLLSRRTPVIINAFKFVPGGVQPGMRSAYLGTREINPEKGDFFRTVIEERKKLPKSHPHYLLLKIIANALYGIFAELNKNEFGKNRAKQLEVFSGDNRFDQTSVVVERPGRFQFPAAASLITAGGRLMLAILQTLVERQRGTYLLTDTDSMLFVASEKGGLFPCPGGKHKMPDGSPAVKAISWEDVEAICTNLNRLNPYDAEIVADVLKIEDCNRDRNGKQQQLYGLAVSAKRYVVYTLQKNKIEIIKPSEHGLGIVFVPDKRKRYTPSNCCDQESNYARWIVEAWQRLLRNHFRNITDPQNALVSQPFWFDNLPAMMRVRVTTPNVLKALRMRDPAAGKPYNFAHSPILTYPIPNCTFVAPASRRCSEWNTRDYIEIHTGDSVRLGSEYNGHRLIPQTVSSIIWRHFLHPEDKSLSPDGKPCDSYTRGLLLRRPVESLRPFVFIGKEIERRAQEGEDVAVLENAGPIRYSPNQKRKTKAADPQLLEKARKYGVRRLMRESGVSQHATERYLRGERVHPSTRIRVQHAAEMLGKSGESAKCKCHKTEVK